MTFKRLPTDERRDEVPGARRFKADLPALEKLRGLRQVTVATHNTNVVYGDADMVIQLDAAAR